MTRIYLLLLAAVWLGFALSGYVVGYVEDYLNGTSRTYFFLQLQNGTLIPLAEPPPPHLVGTGEEVEAELVATEAGVVARLPAGVVERLSATIPRSPKSGPLLVTLVAAKFADVSNEPYSMSYVHDVVFGPFPSMRHFWEYVSGGAVIIRPYYIHWSWATLPRTKADYCNTGNAFYEIMRDIVNILNSRGVRLPSRSYLVVVLNDVPPCYQGAAGVGTLGFWSVSTPYGTILLAVSQIYHYSDALRYRPDVPVYAHEFGHNLGLHHSGTASAEYDNHWDVMGAHRLRARLSSWHGYTEYLLPNSLSIAHLYFLGWGRFVGSGAGSWLVGPREGIYIQASDGVYTVEYKCSGEYERYLDWCGVVVHKVLATPDARGRWVFFVPVFNITGSSSSAANFLDVGQSVWVAGARVSVLWRNSTHVKVVVGMPTLADVVGANATFVVGERAATIDSVAAVYARSVFSPTVAFTRQGRFMESPLFAYLDSERWFAQLRWVYVSNQWVYLPFQYPGVAVSVGGPFPNSLTRALNPPDRPGVNGLPFYYDTGAGGIRDARSGSLLCTSGCFVVAKLQVGSRAVVLAWGLGGEDTRAAAAYLFYRGGELLNARGNAAHVVKWSYRQYSGHNIGMNFFVVAAWSS